MPDAQQGRVGEERALQNARDEGREQDAPQQRDAAVFFLHGRADDQQQEHVVQKWSQLPWPSTWPNSRT